MLTQCAFVLCLFVIPQNRTNSKRHVACEFVYAESPIENVSIGDSTQLNNITLPVPYRVIVCFTDAFTPQHSIQVSSVFGC